MIDLLNLVAENNVNISIKLMDNSYRPLVGRIKYIITLTHPTVPSIQRQIVITDTESDSQIECEFDDALRYIHYSSKHFGNDSQALRDREAFFTNK